MRKTILSAIITLALVLSVVNFIPVIDGTYFVKAISTKNLFFVNERKIDVYLEKSEDSEIVKTIKRFKLVNVVGEIDEDGWVKIKFNDGEYKGFVKSKQLKKARGTDYCVIRARNCAKKVAKGYGWKIEGEKYNYRKFRNDAGYINYWSEIETSFDVNGHYVTVDYFTVDLKPNNYKDKGVYIVYVDGWSEELGGGIKELKESMKVTQKKLSS